MALSPASERPWLALDLSRVERASILTSAIHKAGWSIHSWPGWAPAPLRRLSQSHSLTRRIYLRDDLEMGTMARFVVLAHELEHARRAEEYGRAKWVARYAMGPTLVLSGLILLLINGIVGPAIATSRPVATVAASVLGLVLLVPGAAAWPFSEKFRRTEEVYGFAAGAAAGASFAGMKLAIDMRRYIGGWTLAAYAYPYLVGGHVKDVRREIGRLGIEMQEAAQGGD